MGSEMCIRDRDTLAKRYTIDNSHRTLHGALLDSEILADVFLLMTGGQSALSLDADSVGSRQSDANRVLQDYSQLQLPIVMATADEVNAHQSILENIEKETGERSLWTVQSQGQRQGGGS